jgi:hypothetical protein
MSKRQTVIDKTIKAIDDKIAALQAARAELVEQAKPRRGGDEP